MSTCNRMTSHQHVRLLASVALMALAICTPVQAAEPGHEVLGNWRFASVLDSVEITSINEKQAHKLLGRVMRIRKEGTQFAGEKCGASSFDTQHVEPNLYMRREAQISAVKLQLPNPVTVVDIGCTQVFIKQSNQAVIFWDGFFFDAVRVNQ